jgi:hypothetical protein
MRNRATSLWVLLLAAACSQGTQEIARSAGLPSGTGGGNAMTGIGKGTGGAGPIASGTGGARAPGIGNGEDDAGMNFGPSCATAQYGAELDTLDMLILLDQSGSMTEDDDRWTPTTKAIKSFVSGSAAAGMGVALQYFPHGPDDDVKCMPATYASPDVAMRALPDNAQPIADSIDAHYFTKAECCDTPEHDGTPTRPAMEGVVAYLRGWVKDHKGHTGVVLLATDGEPSPVCDDNGIDEVSQVIADAAGGSPAIHTYVIGIGHEDKLQDLAKAGDTGLDALIVDGTGKDTEKELLDALAKVRGQALPCDFALPQGDGIDPLHVNVQRSAKGKDGLMLVNVGSAAGCDGADRLAWYYDDPDKPSRIVLCPRTCDDASSDTTTRIEIVVGCATVMLI